MMGQEMRWVCEDELPRCRFLEADRDLITTLSR